MAVVPEAGLRLGPHKRHLHLSPLLKCVYSVVVRIARFTVHSDTCASRVTVKSPFIPRPRSGTAGTRRRQSATSSLHRFGVNGLHVQYICMHVQTRAALLPPIWSRFLSLRLTQNSLKIRLALLRILEISPRHVVPSRNAARFSAKSNSYVCAQSAQAAKRPAPS